MKNEHIVYAYAPILDGGNLLLIGVTDIGWEYLKQESGNYLTASPPNSTFSNVKEVWVVRGKNKQEIRTMIETAARLRGVTVSYPH